METSCGTIFIFRLPGQDDVILDELLGEASESWGYGRSQSEWTRLVDMPGELDLEGTAPCELGEEHWDLLIVDLGPMSPLHVRIFGPLEDPTIDSRSPTRLKRLLQLLSRGATQMWTIGELDEAEVAAVYRHAVLFHGESRAKNDFVQSDLSRWTGEVVEAIDIPGGVRLERLGKRQAREDAIDRLTSDDRCTTTFVRELLLPVSPLSKVPHQLVSYVAKLNRGGLGAGARETLRPLLLDRKIHRRIRKHVDSGKEGRALAEQITAELLKSLL